MRIVAKAACRINGEEMAHGGAAHESANGISAMRGKKSRGNREAGGDNESHQTMAANVSGGESEMKKCGHRKSSKGESGESVWRQRRATMAAAK